MRIELIEDYPGELVARGPELAHALADQLTFSKALGRGGRYQSPADFQVGTLWKLHERMTEIGRRRLTRMISDVEKVVGGAHGDRD